MKIFVDTSAWYGYFDKDDEFHSKALAFLKKKPQLITSQLVFIETCSLLHNRLGKNICVKAGDFIKNTQIVEVTHSLEAELDKAWEEFKEFPKSKISLVDITNKILCERLGITEIFAFDQDFQKLGLNIVP